MNWMDTINRTDECVTIGSFKINRLLFVDDLVLLASSEPGLQHPLNGFAAACNITGMKKNTFPKLENFIRQSFRQVGDIIEAGAEVQIP